MIVFHGMMQCYNKVLISRMTSDEGDVAAMSAVETFVLLLRLTFLFPFFEKGAFTFVRLETCCAIFFRHLIELWPSGESWWMTDDVRSLIKRRKKNPYKSCRGFQFVESIFQWLQIRDTWIFYNIREQKYSFLSCLLFYFNIFAVTSQHWQLGGLVEKLTLTISGNVAYSMKISVREVSSVERKAWKRRSSWDGTAVIGVCDAPF